MDRCAVFALILLAGCSGQKPLPPIADALPSNVREAEEQFDERVIQQFPLGSAERNVRSALSEQGFTVGPSGAEFTRSRFPCSTKWIVRWQSAAGKLTSVQGIYGQICP
jgi:hypothetical protein